MLLRVAAGVLCGVEVVVVEVVVVIVVKRVVVGIAMVDGLNVVGELNLTPLVMEFLI